MFVDTKKVKMMHQMDSFPFIEIPEVSCKVKQTQQKSLKIIYNNL